MKCPKCGSRDIDFQESIGQSICVNCGTVLEENTIVSSIEFQVCALSNNICYSYPVSLMHMCDWLWLIKGSGFHVKLYAGIWRSLACGRPFHFRLWQQGKPFSKHINFFCVLLNNVLAKSNSNDLTVWLIVSVVVAIQWRQTYGWSRRRPRPP